MRTIEYSSAFKRDYKRAKATPRYRVDLDTLLSAVLQLLMNDQKLPDSNNDHALKGDWAGYRDCHVKPDLLLIYRKGDDNTLRLARLGSHSDLFR
jgi:mRNA interferase YafQ